MLDELTIVEEGKEVEDTDNNLPELDKGNRQVTIPESSDYLQLHNLNADTGFTKAVDQAKVIITDKELNEEGETQKKFVGSMQDALIKLAELEKQKAELENQNIEYHKELLSTQQLLNENRQKEEKWTNREKRRRYHFDGVKPVLSSVGITEPMNLVLLYILTSIITPFFLLGKLFRSTIGNMIAGADDQNRPKQVRGFLWTMIGVIFFLAAAIAVLFALKWTGVLSNYISL